MGIFHKTPDQKYLSADKKIRRLTEKKNNLSNCDEKKEKRIERQIADQRAIRRVAQMQIEHPATINTTINSDLKIAKTQFNIDRRRKSK